MTNNNIPSEPGCCNVYYDGISPIPPHPENLSQISEERLRLMIDRWEILLKCGICHSVQDSLDDLLQHANYQKPICRVCLEKGDDSNNNCDHPALPISVLMGLSRRCTSSFTSNGSFPSISREELAEGPALLLQTLKELLKRVEKVKSQEHDGTIDAPTKPIQQIPGAKEDDDWAIVMKASKGVDVVRERTSSIGDASRDPSEIATSTRYKSLDRTFFNETLSPPKGRTQNNNYQTLGFRPRNDHGGEVYDPERKRRRRRKDHLTTLSQPSRRDGSQESGTSVQGKDPFEWSNDRDSLSLPESSSKNSENPAHSSSNRLGQPSYSNGIHDKEIPPSTITMILPVSGPKNSIHAITLLSNDRDMPPPDISTRYQHSINSQNVASEPLSQLTQTSYSQPGSIRVGNDDIASQEDVPTTASTGKANIDVDIGENHSIPVNAGKSHKDLCRFSGENADPYDLEASVDSRLLPQTADFAPHATRDAYESSIDSRLLPQTADFLGTVPKQSLNSRSNWSSPTDTYVNNLNKVEVGIAQISSKGTDSTNEDRIGIMKQSPVNIPNADSCPIEEMIGPGNLPQTSGFAGTSLGATKHENPTRVDAQSLCQGGDFGEPPSCVNWKNTEEFVHYSPSTPIELPRPFQTLNDSVPTTDASNVIEVASRATTPNKSIDTGNRGTPTGRILHGDDFDKSTAVTTHELRKADETKVSLITPPCDTASKRNNHRMHTHCIVVGQHGDIDNQLLHALLEGGMCEIYNSSDIKRRLLGTMENSSSCSDVLPIKENTILIVNATSLSSNATLFAASGADLPCHVCIPNFEYLLARTLGWNVVSSEFLADFLIEDTQSKAITSTVWGDIVLYGMSLDAIERPVDSSNSWLKRTLWWNRPDLSPLGSSMMRRSQDISLLSSYHILVPNFGGDAGRKDEDSLSLPSIFGSNNTNRLKQLDFEEVRIDCVFESLPKCNSLLIL